MMLYKILDHR